MLRYALAFGLLSGKYHNGADVMNSRIKLFPKLSRYSSEHVHQIARKYIFEDPERPNTFVMTERDDYPVISEVTNINDRYTVSLKGLWHTNNLSMGGPFISYSFVDEALNRIYYIEGFLFSPGKPQRESLRELRTILSTFKASSELRKSS